MNNATRLKRHALVLLLISYFCLGAERAAADAYCGIYAVYGAANALKVETPVDFQELASPQFVSSRKGSTVADLIKATQALKLSATPFWGLQASSLKTSRDPLILHFSSYGQLENYDHWVLFLGMEDGRATICDENATPISMDLSEVMLRWDGIALAVHTDAQPKTPFGQSELKQRAVWFVFFGSLCFLLSLAKPLIYRPITAGVAIGALILFVSQCFDSESYLNRQLTLNYAARSHAPGYFEKIDEPTLVSLISLQDDPKSDQKLLIVDARFASDFASGSLPQAVNIPITTDRKNIRECLKDFDRNSKVVIFCLSNRCNFDRQIAVKLSGEGFHNISIFEDGWLGWIGAKQSLK